MENKTAFVTGLLALISACFFAFFLIITIFGAFDLSFENVTISILYIKNQDISNYLNYLLMYGLDILIGLNIVGFIAAIVGGALLVNGGSRNNKNVSIAGLVTGMIGWVLVIFSSMVELVFNQQHLTMAEIQNMGLLIYSSYVVTVQPIYYYALIWVPVFMHDLLPYQTGLLISIIYLSTIAAATILGTISFAKTEK